MDAHATLEDDTRIAYTLSGKGQPVVLLHCWNGNRSFWNEQVSSLSQSHKVLALDFPGHGKSDVPEESLTVKKLADAVHEVMYKLHLSPAVVVGHSMGGMVAQQLWVSHSEDVRGLALVATHGVILNLVEPIAIKILREALEKGYRNAFLSHFDAWFTTQSNPKHLAWVREQMLKTTEKVAMDLAVSMQQFDLSADLPRVHVPTLVVCGGEDKSATPERCGVLAEWIPKAQLVMVPKTGHFVQIENPQAVNRALVEFLSVHNL